MTNYILDGHTPVKEDDVLKWSAWFENADIYELKEKINGQ